MVKVRKKHLTLVYGAYELLDVQNEEIYAYLRTFQDEQYLVLLSFSEKESIFDSSKLNRKNKTLIISNDQIAASENANIQLKPYQSAVYKLYE